MATLIGNSVASLFAVKYGPLYYKYIEKDETVRLKYHQGNFQGESYYLLMPKKIFSGGVMTLTMHSTKIPHLSKEF